MEIAKVESIQYEKSNTIETQGKRADIQRWLKQGYYIKEDRNGYWVLVRSARVMVTLSNSILRKEVNMKEDITDYYEKDRISKKIVDMFEKDILNGNVKVYMDDEGVYRID